MKLKAPKTWQMVMIFVSIVLLAVGGGILYVYLTGGFDEDVTYPESIDVLDSDSVYNSTTMQYEAVEDFELTFTTSTESVNRVGITLSFPSGVAVTRDPENGTISDGVIVVPENLVLDQAFTVSLVQQAYDPETFEPISEIEEGTNPTYVNKGGISRLVITPENSTDFNRQITIAVDVPVLDLDIEFVDETTGYEYDESESFIIPEGTNFTAVPVFKPEASAYQYSDNLNSAIANKREKSVFYSLGASADGITLNYTDSGVYFTAHEEVSSGNLVNAFAFANAREENAFAQANSSLQGQAFYNQAISTLSTSDSAVTGNASVSVIEANVGLFSVAQNTEANPYELSVDRLFTIKAGNDASEGAALSAVIQDIHGADLSGMIRGIGARIISATNSNGGDISTSVELRGGETRTTADGQDYTMINSSVRDLAESCFELSSSAEGSIQIGVVLLVQDEERRYNVFGEEKVFYATVTTHVEDSVSWKQNWADIDGITMKIIYADGNPVATEYPHDLSDFAVVPEGNVYQTKMFFVYGTSADEIISVASLGAGTYQIGGSGAELYPLSGSQLVALKAGEVDLIFATVRTDAYGTPVMTEGGLYQLVQVSSPVRVTVENSLRGINSVEVEVGTTQDWSVGSGANMYLAIPTGTNITGGAIETQITMQIHLEEGDGEIFMDEYQDRVSIFASTGPNGTGETFTDIFLTKLVEFAGDISTEEDVITVYLGINPNLQIPDIMGRSYYINVSYDNSISPDITTADVYNLASGGKVRQSITVYNQTTQRLDTVLSDREFDATQTLINTGANESQIVDRDTSFEGLGTLTLTNFNDGYLVRATTDSSNGIRTFDAYGREFEGAYTVESNNYEAVRVTQVGGKYELSFGNVQNGSALITITSGAASASFTMNVTSQGVSAIYVLGTRYENTTAVSYTYTPEGETPVGDGSTEIKLKNETVPGAGDFPTEVVLQDISNGILLVTVKEEDGEPTTEDIFSPGAYDIAFDSTFLSTVSSDFWDMISYKTTDDAAWRTGAAPTAGASIYSVRVNQHFGEDVTIRFNARNDAGTLNFNFDLTIKATATLNSNTLSQVNYGNMTGVEEHTASDTIGVYAGFGINLNDSDGSPTNYFSVENVNWGAVFGPRGIDGSGDEVASGGTTIDTYYIRPDNSGVLRIYTFETVENPSIATIQNGVLTFADVSVATTYNLTLYAVTKIDAGQVVGNSYGYWTDLSFKVYPNLQISYADASVGNISLNAIANSPSYSYTNIFSIERITTLTPSEGATGYLSSIGTVALGDELTAGGLIDRYEFIDAEGYEYLAVENLTGTETRGTITRTDDATLTFTRGEPEKQITLRAYNTNGEQILSKKFTLTLGIDVNTLAEDTSTPPLIYTTSGETSTNAISAITFNGMTSALITSGTVYVNRKWSTSYDETGAPTGMTATLNQINMGQGRFCTLTSTEDDRYTLSFNPRQAIYAEDDAYLSFTFKSGETEYATWQIPIVYSQIGSDFVGNETDSDYDLYEIIHNGLEVTLQAGQEHNLFDKAGLTASNFVETTGLSVSFSYLVDGEVADYSNSVISSLSGGQLTLKNLSRNYAGLTEGVLPIDIRITITNSLNGASQSFVLHVNVQPNATLDEVHYPYSGSAEFVTVASGGNVPIDLDDASNRFPDTANEGGLASTALGAGTYSIVQLLIDGEPAENIQSYVTLSGSTLTLRNPGGTLKNATLTIRKSYANFFGEALDYVFSINSVDVDYALNVEKGSTNAYADEVTTENGRETINLVRTTSDAPHTFSVTTTQTDSANNTSNAPTSVTTVLSQAKSGETTATSSGDSITITIGGANYTFALADTSDTQPTNPKTLTITTPTFVATDTLITLTFVINSGEQTIDVDVLIPATANLEWITDDTLQGGKEYNVAGDLIANLNDGLLGETSSISTSGITVTGVSAEYDETEGAKTGYISTSDSKITIEPIYGATETATIKIDYTYVQNITFGSETYAVLFKPGSTGDSETSTNATLTLQQVGVDSEPKSWTGTGSSSTGGTITIGDGENAVDYTYSYDSGTGELTLTATPTGDSTDTTTSIYYIGTIVKNVHTGYTERTFSFAPNLRSNNRAIKQIVAGTTRQKAIGNGTTGGFGILVPEEDTVLTRSGTYNLKPTNVDSSLFDEGDLAIENRSGGSVFLKITPNHVSQNTPTVIRFTLTYENSTTGYSFTTDVIEMTFTIVAAATLSVNYPQPFGSAPSAYANEQDLGYEVQPISKISSTGSGIDLSTFFGDTGKADLASKNRFTKDDTDPTTDDTEGSSTGTVTYSVRSFSGITANTSGQYYVINSNVFRLASGATISEGASVTFGITYKGVTAEYVVYFFTSPITAQTRSTIHQVVTSDGAYEEIYADQTGIYVGETATATLTGLEGTYTGSITVNGKSYSATYTSSSLELTLTEAKSTTSYTGEGGTITMARAKYYYTFDNESGTLTLTPTTNIFAKNRLVELGIDASAPAGQLQQIWIRPVSSEDRTRDDYELLTSFLLTGSLVSAGNNIFVDIGLIDDDSYVDADNLLNSDYEFVIGSFNSNGNFVETSYLTFIRQASRVEYFYTLSNGGTQLITHTDLTIVEEEVVNGTSGWEEATDTTTRFEKGQIAIFRVQYKIGSGDPSGAVYLQAKKELDITVDNAWTSSNHTVLEMQTNYLNHYTLVDMAGIRHPSTGELLSADNIGKAIINVEVVNPRTDGFENIIGTGEGIPPTSQFVYQTTDGSHDYLTFTQITVSQTDTRVYDFYLFGEGADNDGSYVLLRFTYRAEGGAEEEYYLVVRLIPDYDVRIGGVQVAEAGVTTDGAASNETLPYDFVSREIREDTNAPMNIATASDSIVSFVRRNWDSSNIASSLTYELTVEEEGNGYNAASNIQKLNLSTTSEPKWTLTPADASAGSPAVYTWSNPTSTAGLVLNPDPIAFGSKTYMLTITNAWGFKIEFFFTLSPPTAQNPVISTANTDATYREGETFDVGVIYDLVTVTRTEHEPEEEGGETTYTYDITVARDQLPDDNSGQTKMIVVDNIATWGVSRSSYNATISNPNTSIITGQSLYEQYLYNKPEGETENIVTDSMLYQYVTIESVSFKFGDEEAQLAIKNTSTGVRTNSKLLTSGDLNAYGGWKSNHGIAFNSVQDTNYGALFTVPNLPGWYYGTSNSIQVEVHVTLKYTKGDDTETCDISFPATISRQYSITSKKHVVTDAEEFELSQYISVKNTQNNNNDVDSGNVTYYDDTLEITLPQNGGAATIRVDVTRVTRGGTTTFTGTRTVTNTYQERQQTVYESMSDIVGTTLQPDTDTVVITVTPNDISSGHEDFRVRYADGDITESVIADTSDGTSESGYTINPVSAETRTTATWASLDNDTLYIENSARFSGGYGVIDKTYIVGIDTDTTSGADFYYRHNQTFYLARAYYSLDTGLGETTRKQIDVSDYFVESGSTQIQVKPTPDGEFGNITAGNAGTGSAGNYKIPIGIWGESVNLYTATAGDNGNVVPDTDTESATAPKALSSLFGGAYSITYSYRAGATPSYSFKASGGGAPSDGTVDSTTGQGSFNMTVDDVPRTYNFTVNTEGTLTSVNGHAVEVKSGGSFSSILLTSSVYFEVSDASGSYSQAYFDGTYLYTGDGYTIDRQNYILINIYVKASGGPDKTFERNSRDHLLGSYRIILV